MDKATLLSIKAQCDSLADACLIAAHESDDDFMSYRLVSVRDAIDRLEMSIRRLKAENAD